MIGVDYGSKEVKWFDGKRFGKGLPEKRGLTVGLSSINTLIKETSFPLCRGRQLEKLVINEVTADIPVDPSLLSVAYCPVEKLEKGCRFLIFVEKKEVIDSLPEWLRETSLITLDLIGTAAAVNLHYKGERVDVLDAGEGKLSLLKFEEGVIKKAEIFRGGFRKEGPWREVLPKLEGSEKVILIGGGALSKEVREILKPFNVEIPEFEPFGSETPLYFNAYGLYNFKESPCRAIFSQPSLFSSELFEKNRSILIRTLVLTAASLILITTAQVLQLQYAKKEYQQVKREINEELSKVVGEKILLPEVQIPQKIKELKELKETLKLDQPSALLYLKGISDSVVEGIRVIEVSGSASTGQFTVVGRSSQEESLRKFSENLKKRFEKVSISLAKNRKFKITIWGLKVGG